MVKSKALVLVAYSVSVGTVMVFLTCRQFAQKTDNSV